MNAVKPFVPLSVYSVDDANERDVFDRLFEAAPEKLGAVKTVNVTHVHTHMMVMKESGTKNAPPSCSTKTWHSRLSGPIFY